MRIGSRDITVLTLIHIAILATLSIALVVFAMRTYGSARESWHRGTIISALTESGDTGNVEAGIAACEALIQANPANPTPKFFLGRLYVKISKFKEAKGAFEQAAAAKNVTPEEKSIALAAAGSALAMENFKDGAKDVRPTNIDAAIALVNQGLDAKATPDAWAALAILKSWKEGTPDAELASLVDKALTASPAPGAVALEQLYRLHGALLLRVKKATEANDAFARVNSINPFNTSLGEVKRHAQLTSIMDTNLDPAARRTLIDSVVARAQEFGTQRPEVLLSGATAWLTFANAPDFLTPAGPFDKARAALNQLITLDPKDLRAHTMLTAMIEDRIVALTKELSVPVSGINSEAPKLSYWEHPKGPPDYSKEDSTVLNNIRNLSVEQEIVWQKFTDNATDKREKIEAKLRQILALRRQAWCSRTVEIALRETVLVKAQIAASDLIELDGSGKGHWQAALVFLDRGQLAPAFNALNDAAKRGFSTPDFLTLRKSLRADLEVADYGPAANERQFGAVQVVRVSLKVPDAGILTDIKMDIGGKPAEKFIVGSQVFSLIDDAKMSGSAHKVKITAEAGAGNTLNFPEFTLNVDKDAPVWALTDLPADNAKLPGWQIELKDASGVDWGKLSAGIRVVKASGAMLPETIVIKEGRYTRALPTVKMKSGDTIKTAPFMLAAPADLPAGEYKVWIDVPDTVGNRLKDEKVFLVK